MKVSFVVPAYNVEDYIEECIKSIQQQTISDWELIVVDDGSSDRTYEISKKYEKLDSRIKVITQKNAGVSVARNVGIERASGQWICFVDADDFVHSQLLEMYNRHLNEENDVCFIHYKDFDDNRDEETVSLREKQSCVSFDKDDMRLFQIATFNRDYKGKYDFYKIKLSMPGKFYRKSLIDKNNIKFPVGVKTGEDAIFNLYVYRYAEKGIYIDMPMYFHRVWGSSVSQKFDRDCMNKFEFMHQKMMEYINSSDRPEMFLEAFYERKAWSFGFCCLLNYCHKDNPDSYVNKKYAYLKEYDTNYREIFEKLNLSHFRFQKKVLFWLIKHRAYAFVLLLCNLKR